MEAGLTVATDKEGRDHCVIVVKGTFTLDEQGTPILAEEQVPFVYADAHYGDPGETAIQYECDFAHFKPRCDVLVVGSAYAPDGQPAKRVRVSLAVGSVNKSFEVVGDRVWDKILLSVTPSEPKPFLSMPITYDRAFGGVDIDAKNPDKIRTYTLNPVGVGYYPLTKRKARVGKPLPNTQQSRCRISSTTGKYKPMSFGSIGRNFAARVPFAGTYDKNWLDNICPFLPPDFDPMYFQSAPADQQVPHLRGGEPVRCINMNPQGGFEFSVPRVEVPILYRFRDKDISGEPKIDTLIVEPDQDRFILIWRASTPVGRKLNALREIVVGREPRKRSGSKRRFKSLAEFIAWKRGLASPQTTEQK